MELWHNATFIFICIMHVGKCFAGFFAGALRPLGPWRRTVETRVCAWHKSHSIWSEGKHAVAADTLQRFQPCPSFPFIYFTLSSPRPLFSQSSRVATRLKEHLLTINTEPSVFGKMHYLIIVTLLTVNLIAIASAWLIRFWWSATPPAPNDITKVVAAQAET